jgi:hypothetical protein
MTKTKKMKIEIEWELCKRIAAYYQFSSAVFFSSPKNFPKGTRKTVIEKRILLLSQYKKKFQRLFDEFLGKL